MIKSELKEVTSNALLNVILNLEFSGFATLYKTVLTELLINDKSIKEISDTVKLPQSRTKVVIGDAITVLSNHLNRVNERFKKMNELEADLKIANQNLEKLKSQVELTKSIPKHLKPKLNLSIYDADFSARLRSVCEFGELETIGEVINFGLIRFKKLRNCGEKSIIELNDYLRKNELDWSMKSYL